MRTGVSIWIFALALFAAVPVGARAQSVDDWRNYPSAGNGAEPLDRILPQIRRNYPGRFYDAEGPFMGGDGQMHYRVKWMTPEGRIVWLDTDARTGRVLGSGGGRHDYGNENPYGQNPYGRDQGYDDRRGNRSDERRSHFNDDNFGDRPDRGGPDWNGGGERPDRGDRGGRDWNGEGRDWGGGDRPDRGGDRGDRGGDRGDRGGRHWNGGWGGPWGDHHGH